MRPARILPLTLLAFSLTVYGQNQSAAPPSDATSAPAAQKPAPGAGHDIGSGTGDIGKGAAKGAGDVAAGTGKGAVDLVTLHPVDAAGNVGKGAAKGGKNIAVGAVKGTGKIAKGTGKAIKKVF